MENGLAILLGVIFSFSLLFILAPYIDNSIDNSNITIIIWDYSGEKIYKNPDNYRFGDFGILFEKSGERIVTKNFKLIENKGE